MNAAFDNNNATELKSRYVIACGGCSVYIPRTYILFGHFPLHAQCRGFEFRKYCDKVHFTSAVTARIITYYKLLNSAATCDNSR